MNEQNNNLNNSQDSRDEATPTILTDLEASDADEIKGGPRKGGGDGADIIVFDIVD